MEKIVASIITIGDELLIGQVVDTNSAWMGQELNKNGIWVGHRIAVGDVREDIWQALDQEFQRTEIILITGGLGPTADDITKPLLCDYFGGKMVVDPGALDNVKKIFERLQRPMIDSNPGRQKCRTSALSSPTGGVPLPVCGLKKKAASSSPCRACPMR